MTRFSNPDTECASGLAFASRGDARVAFFNWLKARISPEPLSNAIINEEDIDDVFPLWCPCGGDRSYMSVNWKRTIQTRLNNGPDGGGAVIYHYESDETDDDGIPVSQFWSWTMNTDITMSDEYKYPEHAILIKWRMRAITSYPASHPDWIGTGLSATDSANPNLTAPAGPPAEASTTQPPSKDECPAEPFPL